MSVVTAGAPPEVAASMFGRRLELACRYANWLVGPGVERGLLGPREPERLWDRHMLNCAAVAALIPPGAAVVDIGSGAGLPGVVVAIARPDLRVTLVESMLRRSEFLREVVADLGLEAVVVRRARVEEVGDTHADVVTARAVAPVAKLTRWAAPLLRPGGTLLAMKGASALEDVSGGWPQLVRAGFSGVRLVEVVTTNGASSPAAHASGLAGTRTNVVGVWSPAGVFCDAISSGESQHAVGGTTQARMKPGVARWPEVGETSGSLALVVEAKAGP